MRRLRLFEASLLTETRQEKLIQWTFVPGCVRSVLGFAALQVRVDATSGPVLVPVEEAAARRYLILLLVICCTFHFPFDVSRCRVAFDSYAPVTSCVSYDLQIEDVMLFGERCLCLKACICIDCVNKTLIFFTLVFLISVFREIKYNKASSD